jgi:hypothetical protein
VNEATSEAMRATSEASRRTLQGAQDAMRTTRAYLAESTEANRKLFQAYAQGVEAALKGGFEVQNAIFTAGQSVLDARANSSRDVLQQWTGPPSAARGRSPGSRRGGRRTHWSACLGRRRGCRHHRVGWAAEAT